MWDVLLAKQEYVLFLAAIMVASGIIKDKNYFGVLFGVLISQIKSKRLLVFWFRGGCLCRGACLFRLQY
jgi:Na+/H+ antiporter NhaD/arsenite permease-like protein